MSVVEPMYSCERLYVITGDAVWAERLERLAFNALPAAISDDMWTHRYDQMVNQIVVWHFLGNPTSVPMVLMLTCLVWSQLWLLCCEFAGNTDQWHGCYGGGGYGISLL